jgi:hypothetical protein
VKHSRVILPLLVLAVAALSVAVKFEWPLVLPVLMQLPPVLAFILIGVALTWRFDFLVASAVCGLATIATLWLLGSKEPSLLVLAAFAYLTPFALLQLIFFRKRGAFISRQGPPSAELESLK